MASFAEDREKVFNASGNEQLLTSLALNFASTSYQLRRNAQRSCRKWNGQILDLKHLLQVPIL
jgi:hypothetical protein